MIRFERFVACIIKLDLFLHTHPGDKIVEYNLQVF